MCISNNIIFSVLFLILSTNMRLVAHTIHVLLRWIYVFAVNIVALARSRQRIFKFVKDAVHRAGIRLQDGNALAIVYSGEWEYTGENWTSSTRIWHLKQCAYDTR